MGGLIFIVVILAAMYLLLFRPQQKRRSEQQRLIDSLQVGDDVLTVAGIYGTIEALEDDAVRLRVAPGVTLKLARRAIVSTERREPEPLPGDSAPEPVEPETGEPDPIEPEPR